MQNGAHDFVHHFARIVSPSRRPRSAVGPVLDHRHTDSTGGGVVLAASLAALPGAYFIARSSRCTPRVYFFLLALREKLLQSVEAESGLSRLREPSLYQPHGTSALFVTYLHCFLVALCVMLPARLAAARPRCIDSAKPLFPTPLN